MSSFSLQRSELKEVFDAVEDAFSNLGIDYYVIGALVDNPVKLLPYVCCELTPAVHS